ncbi:terpenoid synthase [Mycena polygramma]|nr:terpenoid synthase [Mycena polygramma]
MSETTIALPDTLRSWPWPRSINPYYEACKKESCAWCEGFHAFDARAQKAFNLCDFNLLASLAFPLLNKEGCRVGCDLMNLFIPTDTVREQASIVMDAIRNPHKPRSEGEWIGGKVAQEFWANAIRTATPTSQRRFVETFHLYMHSVVQQADDLRRDTIGAKPSFAINEIHMNLPDEIIAHPVVKKLTSLCIDALVIGNDLVSWNVEQARGDDGHNVVTIVMHQYNLEAQDAINWISDLHDNIADEFLQVWKTLPTFGGPIDREIRTYVDGLGNWVRANDQWSFESERYFGKKGLEVLGSRKIVQLPKFDIAAQKAN